MLFDSIDQYTHTMGFALSTFIGGSIPNKFISEYISNKASIVSTNPVQPNRRALFIHSTPILMNAASPNVKLPSHSAGETWRRGGPRSVTP